MDTLEYLALLYTRLQNRIKIDPAIPIAVALVTVILVPVMWSEPLAILISFATLAGLIAAGYTVRALIRWGIAREMARQERDELVHPRGGQTRRTAKLN